MKSLPNLGRLFLFTLLKEYKKINEEYDKIDLEIKEKSKELSSVKSNKELFSDIVEDIAELILKRDEIKKEVDAFKIVIDKIKK